MRTLKPYPAYKESGVPWLGDVPSHWEMRRLKTLCSMKSGESITTMSIDPTGQYPVYGGNGLRGYTARYTHDGPHVLMGRQGALCGNIHIAHGRFWASEHAVVSTLHRDHVLEWFSEILTVMNLNQYSIAAAQPGLAVERILELWLPVPPLTEQTVIARFLDHADRRIRRYIRAKEKLIALLEEQKQAIIHQAVTGRIDVRTGQPYPAYKPSVVEWLGDVPEHWNELPLKRWVSTKITDGPHETPILMPSGIPFMSAESMVGGRLDFSRGRGFISQEQHNIYCRKCKPRRDDIFMCKSGATTGKVAIVDTAAEFSVWSPLALIRVNPKKALPRLLFSVLQAHYVQRQVKDAWSYGTQPNLAMGAMEQLVVALPPVREQQEVLTHLDRALESLSKAIDDANRQIDLHREYWTRLIADVVTGKLDVREAAAALPEVDPLAAGDEAYDPLDASEKPAFDDDQEPAEVAG